MTGQLDRRWFGTAGSRSTARPLSRIALPEAPDEVTVLPVPPAPVESAALASASQESWWSQKLSAGVPVQLHWTPWLTGLLLYLGAACLLLFDLDWHPPVYFNWEEYTAWGIFHYLDAPTFAHFAP